jgi:DNA-binding Lrp family transcriptional regulator
MDEKDLILTRGLGENPRISYRELADLSDLSINSVHKRVQYLVDVGNITGFYAHLGPSVERFVVASALGKTSSNDLEATIAEAGKDEHSSQIVVATNDFIYPQWHLRDMSELDDFMAFAREVTLIESPQVVFRARGPPTGYDMVKLSGLDYRIIASLMNDARKPEKMVAEELGVSPKTVHRHLERMQKEGSILLETSFRSNSTPDIFSFFHMTIKKNVDRREASVHLRDTYKPQMLDVQVIESEPYLFISNVWTQTMMELKDVRTRVEKDECIESLSVNVFYDYHRFETWRHDLVRKRAVEAARRP